MKEIILLFLIIISSDSYSQNGEFVFDFNYYKVIKVENTYSILTGEDSTIIEDLKYVNYAGYSNSLQVLDKYDNVIYFDSNLDRIKIPKEDTFEVCGTVVYYEQRIIEDSEHYYVELSEDRFIYGEGVKKSIIDTIPKNGIKQIYFANSEKKIEYDGNFYFPTYIILDLGNKFGIKNDKVIEYYDSINLENPFAIKVRIKESCGYYGITEVIYKSLGKFEYNLANFIDRNGDTGYVDLDGNVY